MKDAIAYAVFALAVAFLAFLLGTAVGIFRVFPYGPINEAFTAAATLLRSPTGFGAAVNEAHHLYPVRYPQSGVTVHRRDAVQPGITLVSGYWWQGNRWQPAIRLMDMEGTVLHEWTVHPDRYWPTSPYTDHVAGVMNNANNYVHGSWLLPDGHVVFNVEYAGMVRLDACGAVVWTLPYRTHHSVSRDDNGNFWASGLIWREAPVEKYVHMRPRFVDETMLQISPDGEILREIFILESMYDSGYGGIFASTSTTLDVTHMNDVEVLSAAMADAFPLFEAGDILVSLRNIGTVVVVDGKTERVKWHMQHPLVKQHDPDFEPDGHIVIFDNRDDMTQSGMRLGPSRLLRVNPVTNEFSTVYPLSDAEPFYTQTGGKHQLLANGNRLITESNAGRVFEVSPDGEVLWNWVIEPRGELVPEVLEGSRYPAALAQFDRSACNAG